MSKAILIILGIVILLGCCVTFCGIGTVFTPTEMEKVIPTKIVATENPVTKAPKVTPTYTPTPSLTPTPDKSGDINVELYLTFMDGCMGGDASSFNFCDCVALKLFDRYTYSELIQLNERVSRGEMPDEYFNLVMECL